MNNFPEKYLPEGRFEKNGKRDITEKLRTESSEKIHEVVEQDLQTEYKKRMNKVSDKVRSVEKSLSGAISQGKISVNLDDLNTWNEEIVSELDQYKKIVAFYKANTWERDDNIEKAFQKKVLRQLRELIEKIEESIKMVHKYMQLTYKFSR